MKKFNILLFILAFTCSGFAGIVKKKIPDRLVVLTFDDATASHYSVVAPLLKEYGFGASFFICEYQPNFKDTAKYMNWRQIRELDRMGFEIANHTRTHRAVNLLPGEKFVEELNYIERKCDSMGISRPTTFAYPAYNLSLPVLNILQDKDYLYARAGGGRAYDPLSDHPLLIPSWDMNSGNKKKIMDALEEAHDGEIVVLTIHGVPDVEHPRVNTTPEVFKEYLQYLYDNDYTVISMRDLSKYIRARKAGKTIVPDLDKKLKN